eukprot:3199394-Amphidinium_carterae.1
MGSNIPPVRVIQPDRRKSSSPLRRVGYQEERSRNTSISNALRLVAFVVEGHRCVPQQGAGACEFMRSWPCSTGQSLAQREVSSVHSKQFWLDLFWLKRWAQICRAATHSPCRLACAPSVPAI